MSDDAVLWKLAFGVLVLVVCGMTVTLRKPPAHAPAPAPVPASAAPQPQPPRPIPAPRTLEAQEDSPRIEIVLRDARKHAPVPRAKARRSAQHRVVAVRTRATPRRAVPPRIHRVVASGPQYPFDRRDSPNPGF
jgi:hypothetical protein